MKNFIDEKLFNNLISVTEATKMRENYLTNVAPLIEKSKSSEYEASDFIWIDLEILKQYVALLDDVNALNKEQVSGVRIYFAQHLTDAESNMLNINKSKYPGRETVFFAPTTKAESTELSSKYPNLENIPFYISHNGINPLEGKFMQIDNLSNKFDSQLLMIETDIVEKGQTSLLMDNMTITPPPKE